MALTELDRQKIAAVPLCGPRMADYLALAGIQSFDALADADAEALRLAVNAALGHPRINAMGMRAFRNAIAAAKAERAGRRADEPEDSEEP